MNRKLKALGLALVVVFAMTALSAATASGEQFHAGAHGTVQGLNVGEETVTVNAGTWKCKVNEFNGTIATSTPGSLTVKPTHKECTVFGFVNMAIDVGTCEYRFNTPVNTTSTVDIINCGATPITVTGFNCWITFGNQSGLGHVIWSNQVGPVPHDVHATLTISGTAYTQHSKSFPGCTNGTFSNGKVDGTTTWRAFNTLKSQAPLTVT
jgi:hypothetical protein